MKVLLSVLFVFITAAVFGQSTLFFRGDTIKFMKAGGSTNVVIGNKTKDTLGIAVNTGGGLLEYQRPRQLTDTTILIGNDTLRVGSGTATEVDTTNTIATYYRLYKVTDSIMALVNVAGDDWGNQTVVTTAYLRGMGTDADSLSINTDSIYTKYQVDSIVTALSISGGADGSLIAGTDSVAHTSRLKGKGTNAVKLDVDTTVMSTHWYVDSVVALVATPGLTSNNTGTLTNSNVTVPTDLTVQNGIADAIDAATFSGASLIPGWIVFTDVSGVVADGSFSGGTDNSPELNGTISTVADYTKIIIPRGNFRFNSTITIPTGKHIIIENYGRLFFGSNVTGFIIDGNEQSFYNYGKIYGRDETTINYSGLTSIGVWVRNAENGEFHLGYIEGFKYGTRVGGYATGATVAQGAQFNKIHWNYLRRNSVGLDVHPSGGNGSWSNGNWIYASKIVADTGVIFRPDVTDRPANNVNGNIIYGLGLENGGSPSIPMKLGIYMDFASSNAFIGMRIEPTPITKKFYFTSSVNNTGLIGVGYIAWQWLDNIGNNTYISGPIYDDVAGISVGNFAQGYRVSGTNTFYNGRIRVFGTTRSPSAMGNVPSNVDVDYTNETSILITGPAYTVLPGIKTVRVNNSSGSTVISMPPAGSNPDRQIIIKNLSGSNSVTVFGVQTGEPITINPKAGVVYESSGGGWISLSSNGTVSP